MKKDAKENGITLVALVVTIIVLLILAGVSLSLVLGDNGIITRAQDAVTKYKEAETTEEWEMNNFMYSLNVTNKTPRELQNSGYSVGFTEEGYVVADTINDILYYFNNDGAIEKKEDIGYAPEDLFTFDEQSGGITGLNPDYPEGIYYESYHTKINGIRTNISNSKRNQRSAGEKR